MEDHTFRRQPNQQNAMRVRPVGEVFDPQGFAIGYTFLKPMGQKMPAFWKKYYSVPAEHGAWIWWIGPLILGAFAGGIWNPGLIWLTLAALIAFLSRQPASVLVKTFSGRRPARERKPALIWLSFYAAVATLSVAQLIRLEHTQVLYLAVPAIPILVWHFALIAQRRERKQMGIEIIGTGTLALAAPAAYWVGGGNDSVFPWILWLVSWLQSAASITLVYLRLAQKDWVEGLSLEDRLRRGSRALAYHGFNFVVGWAVVVFSGFNPLAGIAFTLMLVDALWAILQPAHNWRPKNIGMRQLASSGLFFLMLILSLP
jgi:hypothetical protein